MNDQKRTLTEDEIETLVLVASDELANCSSAGLVQLYTTLKQPTTRLSTCYRQKIRDYFAEQYRQALAINDTRTAMLFNPERLLNK